MVDALAAYESALSVKTSTDASALDTSETLTKRAIAEANLKDFGAADTSAATEEDVIKPPMRRDADEQRRYVSTLQSTLLIHAQIKRLHGDEKSALELEAKARALPEAK